MNSKSFRYLNYLQLNEEDIILWTKSGKVCLDMAHQGKYFRVEAGDIDDAILKLMQEVHPDQIAKIDAQDLLEMLFGDCILPKTNAWLNEYYKYYEDSISPVYKRKWCKILEAYELLVGYKWVRSK